MASNQAGGSGGKGGAKPHIAASDYMPKMKIGLPAFEAEARYGKFKQPIPATQVYQAPIERFSSKDVNAEKWILINENQGTMTFVNTYDGKTGPGYDMVAQTQPLDAKRLATKIRDGGYTQTEIDKCPVAVTIDEAKKHHLKGAEEVADEVRETAGEGSARVSSEEGAAT